MNYKEGEMRWEMMDLVVIFGLISIAFVRLIGLGVGIDFLLVRRKRRFAAQVSGWSIWSIGSFLEIISQFTYDTLVLETFQLLFGTFTLVGSFLISIGIIVNFHPLPPKNIFFMTILLLILPFGVYLLFDLETSVSFSIFGSYMVIAGLYIIGILEDQNFKREVGQSVKWFYGLLIIGIIQLIVYLFFTLNGIDLTNTSQIEDTFAYTVVNSISIAITVLIVILLIHLENSRSILYNFKLKDTYSHDLANLIQVMISAIHIIEKNTTSISEKENTLELLDRTSKEILKLLQEIRTLE
jgi:hypothetical protein